MEYKKAEQLLTSTYEKIKDQHPEEGHRFISAHWGRYCNMIASFPDFFPGAVVLEIGASILSNVIQEHWNVEMHTVHHELEKEWIHRHAKTGIHTYSIELLRDPLPFKPEMFDYILFSEVMEHFPLSPDFFIKNLMKILKPKGELLFGVPNYATWEHRIKHLFGGNSQDPMDDTYIYYAHHREFVMRDCLDYFTNNGGVIASFYWTDHQEPLSFWGKVWSLFKFLKHLEWNKIIHLLIPSMRSYIELRVKRDSNVKNDDLESTPPLQLTNEYMRENRAFPLPGKEKK